MSIGAIGKIISLILVVTSGQVLAFGISFYRREKKVGVNRILLLVYALAAHIWSLCFGVMGFCANFSQARALRFIGIFGIDLFLSINFCIVTDMSRLNPVYKKITKWILCIAYIGDFILFSGPSHDAYYHIDGFITWKTVDTVGRTYHSLLNSACFVLAAFLGISAYFGYTYQRQKKFLIGFYIANICLAVSSLFDTVQILDYALPTSGLGANLCAVVLIVGTQKYGAFDISVAGIADSIFKIMNCGVIVLDEKRKIRFVNPYSSAIIGSKKIIGKTLPEIFDIKDNKMDLYFAIADSDEKNTLHLQTIDSKVRCSCQLTAVFDEYKDTQCYILSLVDISDELSMLEELREANKVKTNFLTSMSHEIRTPINTVLGMNEMIRRESKDDKIRSYASKVDIASRQLLAIINDILDYSNIESGSMQLYSISYDVSSMVNDIYHVVEQKINSKGLKFKVHVNAMTPSWLIGDEVRINQIIMNLLTNAIKYTDAGFISLDMDYEMTENNQINLLISVRDSGCGIENVSEVNLFSTFSKIGSVNNQSIEGTGLGLAITKSLLTLMNGTISVESIYGVGTKFSVSIPQRISNDTPVGNIEERINKINQAKSEYLSLFTAPEGKVLVVDDVEMNLMVVEELLKPTKLQIDCVTSGYDALRKCREKQYNLILMDHMMPGIDGIECLRRLRATEGINQHTPVIVLTANAIAGMRDKYMEEGFSDYLTKPIDGTKLEAAIVKYLPESIVRK